MRLNAQLALFLLLQVWSISLTGQARLYPAPAGVPSSAEYRVWINGEESFVYDSPVPASFCSFEMDRPVEVLIRVNRDIKWADIRPLSAGVKAKLGDSSIRFTLQRPARLSIEINGKTVNPLFLFAQVPESTLSGDKPSNTLFFKAGAVYFPGIIALHDNQSIYIEGGAVVVGVITADHARNIRIGGRGVLIGTNNRNFIADSIRSRSWTSFMPHGGKGEYQQFVSLNQCEDVIIDGPVFLNSSSWQLVPMQCNRVTIRNVKIISDQPSDDGIDVVHSRRVTIEDCFIRTKDDCIAIKSYLNDSSVQGSGNILVRRCVFWNAAWGNALEIGFELNARELSDIRFEDCDIIHVEAGAAFSIHNAGRALVQRVFFENIRVEDARQKLFDLAILRSTYSNDAPKSEQEKAKEYLHGAWDGVLAIPPGKRDYYAGFRGHIRHITFRNIQIVDGGLPFSIFYGFDREHLVSDVNIENLQLYGKRLRNLAGAKCYVENAEQIQIH